jgi:hypothetical protein
MNEYFIPESKFHIKDNTSTRSTLIKIHTSVAGLSVKVNMNGGRGK